MKKLLLVKDDVNVAKVYQNKLREEGFLVEIAADGQLGYDLTHSFRPDVVILDLMLPKLPGVELMQKLRAEPDFKKLPFIVFSNTYMSSLAQEAWKAGATKCLSKANCTPKQVIEIVHEVLGDNVQDVETPVSAKGALQTHKQKSEAEADAEFQADLSQSFVESLPATLAILRGLLQNLVKAGGETARLKQINQLYRRVQALTGNAGLTGMLLISQMSAALEALLRELQEHPKNINDSTLRTVAATIDFLGVLFEKGTQPDRQEIPPANILVVDDEAISRRALTYAINKANLKSTGLDDPVAALQLLSEKKFDLIFLDVDMPNMTGFELCSKLRALPGYAKTPVIFVTGLNDFKSRASSTMSGGNDFIAKPFLFIELAVKSLMHVMRGGLETN